MRALAAAVIVKKKKKKKVISLILINIGKTHQPCTGEISVPKAVADLHVHPASRDGVSLGLQRLTAA